jgi:hypothetical protein
MGRLLFILLCPSSALCGSNLLDVGFCFGFGTHPMNAKRKAWAHGAAKKAPEFAFNSRITLSEVI